MTDWANAECIGSYDLFTADDPDYEACRAICDACVINDECLTDAYQHQEFFFMRGGMTPEQRGVRLGARQPPHGTPAGYAWHRRNGSPVCSFCRLAYNEASKIRQVKYKEKKRALKTQPPGSNITGDGSAYSLPLTKGDPTTGYNEI